MNIKFKSGCWRYKSLSYIWSVVKAEIDGIDGNLYVCQCDIEGKHTNHDIYFTTSTDHILDDSKTHKDLNINDNWLKPLISEYSAYDKIESGHGAMFLGSIPNNVYNLYA